MEIYKFRRLTSEIDYCRLRGILETGYFWCSNFWDLNDPMEGVFSTYNVDIIDKIFRAKEQYKICSFSGTKGFPSPIMWGYYAAGFKGVAIELEVDIINDCCDEKGGVKKIECDDDLPNADDIEKILLNKSTKWEHEDEYRFLIKSENNYHKIKEIKITAVYFGAPYGDLINSEQIKDKSKSIRDYVKFKGKIIEVAKKIKINCFNIKVEKGVVKKMYKNLWSQKLKKY